jgi:CDP-diglyceride synthetase
MLYINLLVTLVIVAVVLWLINRYVPMDYKMKSIVNIVVVFGMLIWLLSVLSGVPIFQSYPPG